MIKPNPLRKLNELGQSVWYDYIRRDLIENGELDRMIRQDSLGGMTTNPSIFQAAIAKTSLYDEDIRRYASRKLTAPEIFERLAIKDVTAAADKFLPVFQASGGTDGWVSLEVSPHLAYDAAATTKEAARLHMLCSRPNVMIKIPGTKQGIQAIHDALFQGVSVNVTLLFSVSRYREVMNAYIAGMEERLGQKFAIRQMRSVASFFVSRVDTLIDPKLDAMKDPAAAALRTKAAVANAKLAYAAQQEVFSSQAFARLKDNFVAPQRALWASTSAKDPKLQDIFYVEQLIGEGTVNTIPPATYDAYKDHGDPKIRITDGAADATRVVSDLARLGIDLEQVATELEVDGVKKFVEAFDSLMAAIDEKSRALVG